MKVRPIVAGTVSVLAVSHANAQTQREVRQIGPVEHVSTESLMSVAAALPMPGGHVLVNDIRARRLLLFDSTLSRVAVVADTTTATANAYGDAAGTLIRFRRDSALFIDPASLSMFVLGPTGKTARILAVPRPNETRGLIGGLLGAPGVDPRGRLVYFTGEIAGSIQLLSRGSRIMGDSASRANEFSTRVESAFVARVDLATRAVDTVASIRVPKWIRSFKADPRGELLSIETTPDPLPLPDDWAMLSDGTIAVARGRDYHVDFFGADGRRWSGPKLPFEWQRVDDARKEFLIDSTVSWWRARFDQLTSRGSSGRSGGSGRGRGGMTNGPSAPVELLPNLIKRPTLGDLPDYVPPFERGASYPDADGHLWIRTSAMVQGRPVYDVVDARGTLTDRIQLPAFRTIAGFGPGVIFMAVKDSAGIVHLERARVK